MPRARISRSMASAVYILPTEQSVPIASSRRPLPPPAVGDRIAAAPARARRAACARAPSPSPPAPARRAGGCAGPTRGRCRPPAPRLSTLSQAGAITPPRLATPTTSVRTPAAAAAAMSMSGRPMSAWHPCIRYWPIAASGRQSRMPCATLAASASGASPRNRRYGVSIMRRQPSATRRGFTTANRRGGRGRRDRHVRHRARPLFRSETPQCASAGRTGGRRRWDTCATGSGRRGRWPRPPATALPPQGQRLPQLDHRRTARPAPGGRRSFPAESGRYHLYVSYACPWAHRTLIFRALKGLTEHISVDVVHPLLGDDGWSFDTDFPGATGDRLGGRRLLREVYLDHDPALTSRVSVPVLWDKATGSIVSNEFGRDHPDAELAPSTGSPATRSISRPRRCAPRSTRSTPGSTTASTTASTAPASRAPRPPTTSAVGEVFATLDWLEARLTAGAGWSASG